MRARTPERAASFSMRLIIGRTNASVLPVPVCAVATTSRPASAGSIDWAWTAVGSVKPFLNRLLFTRAEIENSEKLFIVCLRRRIDNRLPVKGERLADQLPVGSSIQHSRRAMLRSIRCKADGPTWQAMGPPTYFAL